MAMDGAIAHHSTTLNGDHGDSRRNRRNFSLFPMILSEIEATFTMPEAGGFGMAWNPVRSVSMK